MVELTAIEPLNAAPVRHGVCEMSPVTLGVMTQIMPFAGQNETVGRALGVGLPKPNRFVRKNGVHVQWFGRDTYLVRGDVPDLGGLAAVTDQGDGWAAVRLQGDGAEDVLARLVPVDVRRSMFKRGHTMRTMIQHMNGSVSRVGPDAFEVMVMRSMAQTLWHDVETAMKAVAKR